MKTLKIILIFIWLVLGTSLSAQEKGDINNQLDSVSDISKLDSLEVSLLSKLDSLNSLDHINDDIDSIKTSLQAQLSIINANVEYKLTIDSLTQAYQSKADSLQSIGLPHEKYLSKVDSLVSLPERKVNEKVQALNEKIENKVAKVKQKLTGDIDGNLNEHIDMDSLSLKSKLPNNMKVPDAKLDATLGNATEELEIDKEIPALGEEIGLRDQLNTDQLDNIKEELEVDKYKSQLDEVKSSVGEKVEDVKESIKIDEAKSELGKVNELGSKIEEVNTELKNVQEGNTENLEQKVQEEVLTHGEFEEIQKQQNILEASKEEYEEYFDMKEEYLKGLNESPEEIQEQILEKSKKLANTHLSDQKDKIALANEKIDKYKKWHDNAKSVKKLKSGILIPVDDKSVGKRLGLSLNIELLQFKDFKADIAPGLRYNLLKRIQVGTEFVFRYDHDNRRDRENDLYGLRGMIKYDIKPKVSLILQGEQLRYSQFLDDGRQRVWYKGVFFGLGKSYTLSKKLALDFTAVHTIHTEGESPYQRKFNVRFGLRYSPFTKKKK